MIVPHERLSPEALDGVLEEYVTRDGTELSEAAAKIESVRRALDRGELFLVFDAESESCNILSREQIDTASAGAPQGQTPLEPPDPV